MKELVLAILVCAMHSCSADDCFVATGLDRPWTRRCKQDQSVSKMISIFKAAYYDRYWTICCRQIPVVPGNISDILCEDWSGYTQLGKDIDFSCPTGSFINGIESLHDNDDRQYRFRCCKQPETLLYNCRANNNWANYFRKKLDFEVEEGKVMVGMEIQFCRSCGDRSFDFVSCEMKKRTSNP